MRDIRGLFYQIFHIFPHLFQSGDVGGFVVEKEFKIARSGVSVFPEFFENFSNSLLTIPGIGSTMNIDEQMFGTQKRRERYGVWRSVDGVFGVRAAKNLVR